MSITKDTISGYHFLDMGHKAEDSGSEEERKNRRLPVTCDPTGKRHRSMTALCLLETCAALGLARNRVRAKNIRPVLHTVLFVGAERTRFSMVNPVTLLRLLEGKPNDQRPERCFLPMQRIENTSKGSNVSSDLTDADVVDATSSPIVAN